MLNFNTDKKLSTRFPDTQKNLELLAQKCGEIIVSKSKILRFGLKRSPPYSSENNIENLEHTIGDMLAIVQILIANGVLSELRLNSYMEAKLENLEKGYRIEPRDQKVGDTWWVMYPGGTTLSKVKIKDITEHTVTTKSRMEFSDGAEVTHARNMITFIERIKEKKND